MAGRRIACNTRVKDKPSGYSFLPELAASKVDQISIEAAQPKLDCAILARLADKEIILGVLDLGDMAVETPALVAERIRRALAYVAPDGQSLVAAEEMHFPNGPVITPDGKTLILGETLAGVLTAFDIQPNGDLLNRRVWATISPRVPDGVCLDAEGAIDSCVAAAPGSTLLSKREASDTVKVETSFQAALVVCA